MDPKSPPSTVMPLNFYNMPSNCRAIFSTSLGTKPKRMLRIPYPTQVVHSDMLQDVQIEADLIRKQFPELIYEVHLPSDWYQLYDYFDAFDIYVHGAYFLMEVLFRIAEENSRIVPVLMAEIEKYASEWITFHKHMVISPNTPKDLLQLLSPEEISGAKSNERILLRRALEKHRDLLLMRLEQPRTTPFRVDQPQNSNTIQQPVCFVATPLPLSGQVLMVERNQPAYIQPSLQARQTSDRFASQNCHANFHGGHANAPSLNPQPRPRGSSIEFHRTLQQTHARRYVSNPGTFLNNRPPGESTYVNQGTQQTLQRKTKGKNHTLTSPAKSRRTLRQQNDPFSEAVSETVYSPKVSAGYHGSLPPQDARHYVSSTEGLSIKTHQRLRSSGSIHPSQLQFEPKGYSTNQPERVGRSHRKVMRPISSGISMSGPLFENDRYGRRQYTEHGGILAPIDRNVFYGNKVPFANDPNATFSHNGACQYAYAGDTQSRMDREGSRTAFINVLEQSSFESHLLKDIMEPCGRILSIVFWPLFSDNFERKGHAFVIFETAESAIEAIKKFNGYAVGNGETLAVNYPRKTSSQSNSSRARQTHHKLPYDKYFDDCTHGDSAVSGQNIRNQPGTYHTHLYSARQSRAQSPDRTPLTDGFQRQLLFGSHTAEMNRPQAAGTTRAALEIVNTNIEKDRGKACMSTTDLASAKKGNLLGNESATTEASEKQLSQANSITPKPTGKTKKKAFKKPNANRQTPHTTPTKSRSERNLDHVIDSVSHAIGQLGEVHKENSAPKRKNSIAKPHQGARKGKGKPAEKKIDSIEELVSPIDSESTVHTTSKSTSTSISKRSSRNTSITSSSFTCLSEAITPKASYSEGQMTLSSNATPPNSVREHPSLAQHNTASDTSHATAPVPRLEKSISRENVKYTCSFQQVTNLSAVDFEDTAEVLRVANRQKLKTHAKKGSDTSSVGNTAKTTAVTLKKGKTRDLKRAFKQPLESDPGSSNDPRSISQQSETSTKLDLDDKQQFPSLEPTTLLSPIANVKHPIRPRTGYSSSPPVMGPLNQRNKSSQKSQISSLVAIPRALQSTNMPEVEWKYDNDRNAPLNDIKQGSRSWPFVKSFRGNQ